MGARFAGTVSTCTAGPAVPDAAPGAQNALADQSVQTMPSIVAINGVEREGRTVTGAMVLTLRLKDTVKGECVFASTRDADACGSTEREWRIR
jgi:hypothetical protein